MVNEEGRDIKTFNRILRVKANQLDDGCKSQRTLAQVLGSKRLGHSCRLNTTTNERLDT